MTDQLTFLFSSKEECTSEDIKEAVLHHLMTHIPPTEPAGVMELWRIANNTGGRNFGRFLIITHALEANYFLGNIDRSLIAENLKLFAARLLAESPFQVVQATIGGESFTCSVCHKSILGGIGVFDTNRKLYICLLCIK